MYLRFYVDRQHFTTCKSIHNLLNFITAFLLQIIPYTSLCTLVHYTFRYPYTSLCILLNFSFRSSPYIYQSMYLIEFFLHIPYIRLCTLLHFSFKAPYIRLYNIPSCFSPSKPPKTSLCTWVYLTAFILQSP